MIRASMTALAMSLFAVVAVSQSTTTCKPGHFTGMVTDMTGETVPEPTITIETTKQRTTLRGDKIGRFEIDLITGLYSFQIKADGFKTLIDRDVRVADVAITRTFPLDVGNCSDCNWLIEDGSGSAQYYAYEDPAIVAPV